ncbi:MAG: hypothetical protein EBV03_13130 [Proteobacteria bacterium]|nr:hypothetical protein [Pseudomonadota bacterium]
MRVVVAGLFIEAWLVDLLLVLAAQAVVEMVVLVLLEPPQTDWQIQAAVVVVPAQITSLMVALFRPEVMAVQESLLFATLATYHQHAQQQAAH